MADDNVRHVYLITIDVPRRSGDGWHRYPDYSVAEIGRLLRRAIYAHTEHAHTVTPALTSELATLTPERIGDLVTILTNAQSDGRS